MSATQSHDAERRVGLIGLGLMGSALAFRLRAAGYALQGFDTEPLRVSALVELGGEPAGSANEVFSACRRVFLSLPSHHEVASILAQAEGKWQAGRIVLDTTTGSPKAAIEHARQLARSGAGYLDATLSGSSDQVRDGVGLWIVGGDRSAFEQCINLLQAVVPETAYIGAAGSGAKMKLAINLVLGLNRAALAEGLAFARGLDLDLERTLEIMRLSIAYSRVMDTKGNKMISEDFSPQARLAQHLKDVQLILAAARLRLPLSEAHRQLLDRAVALGYGELDNSAIIRVLDQPLP